MARPRSSGSDFTRRRSRWSGSAPPPRPRSALDRLTANLRAGLSAREVAAQLTMLMIQEGADLRAPGGIGAEFSSLPDDHAFAAGEVIRFDFGAVRQGYWADICRRVAFGRNEQAERHQEILNQMMARMMGELGPGVPVTRFHALHDAELKRAGYPPLPPSKRIGHGLGLDPSEPPSLSGEDDTVLEPGMVVTLEPRFNAAYGLAHIEETFVITDAGSELISGGQSKRLITV